MHVELLKNSTSIIRLSGSIRGIKGSFSFNSIARRCASPEALRTAVLRRCRRVSTAARDTSISDIARTWSIAWSEALNSAIYGFAGRQRRDDGLVIERLRRAPQETSTNEHTKAFVRSLLRRPHGKPPRRNAKTADS